MIIVLDSNVLVSGLLSPFGPPGTIVKLVAAGTLRLAYDARILSEYRDVLLRPAFGFDAQHVEVLLDQIEAAGVPTTSVPLNLGLPDPDDEPFLEVAQAAQAQYLVTGNLKHFPAARRGGTEVILPAEFVKRWLASLKR